MSGLGFSLAKEVLIPQHPNCNRQGPRVHEPRASTAEGQPAHTGVPEGTLKDIAQESVVLARGAAQCECLTTQGGGEGCLASHREEAPPAIVPGGAGRWPQKHWSIAGFLLGQGPDKPAGGSVPAPADLAPQHNKPAHGMGGELWVAVPLASLCARQGYAVLNGSPWNGVAIALQRRDHGGVAAQGHATSRDAICDHIELPLVLRVVHSDVGVPEQLFCGQRGLLPRVERGSKHAR